ncbi:F-type H+-transporting ATPase subunit c [Clostridium acetobutylicum]|uniref:ATP synthase subunit c n=1 Tax=Clostridium acetobutylicum (strain ATCC 824 / DSM 792 / JCM 1419 / IAM 19013 / LMG 5710 / NBRC 13948 / NRRL B-527 / VKM B-1787 / 2291 / W) TaxID=272562 RepID=ATPL_CLOAB|nr:MULTISPECIES: ATP synthase F0 subunit C [Clostridium]O08310.1 RecName: Full=ATP synthase subunit c; AltName: Full=ATP synthase F(0) sector subunit c; AltName: Full=F-type ATPase subunit c; Short=F-ATPase subunit c; AltName: Full=Lipid-binding protein [Clostridium acetobutylicum ATCC 824]AAB50192.1 F-type ATP synthase subunit c [Clostridium acetobutylicum ATCC 824]AAD16421.1 ATP synthase subunit c [Clostridium acetobutylicum ATCC 824]AAK80813.1 FoF1-type ATP synthase C subunit [Clostridium ac
MNIDSHTFLLGMQYLGAGLAAIGCIGGGVGIGTVTGKAVEAIGRQPESASKVMPTMIMGLAFAEVTSLYALFVAIMLLFVK